MNNPVPPAIRFLQNFPGECNRTAFYIAKAICHRPVVSLVAAALLGKVNFVAWPLGGLAIKALPELPKFIQENAAPVSIKVTSMVVLTCFLPVISTGLTVYVLKTIREAGEQIHHPERQGPWGYRPMQRPFRQP